MTSILIFWHSLPFLIKVFVILVVFYFYIIICIQIYSRYETYRYQRNNEKNKEAKRLYGQIFDQGFQEILRTGACEDPDFLEARRVATEEKYVRIECHRRVLFAIEAWQKSKEKVGEIANLYSYIYEHNFYHEVIKTLPLIGIYNMLIILAKFRDPRALSVFDKQGERFWQDNNLYISYLVMLGYSELKEQERLEEFFRRVVERREVSNEKLYLSVLINHEGDVLNWQEKALREESTSQKVIALSYFLKIKSGDYVGECSNLLEELWERKELKEREKELSVLVVLYLSIFQEKTIASYRRLAGEMERSNWMALLSELQIKDGMLEYEYE